MTSTVLSKNLFDLLDDDHKPAAAAHSKNDTTVKSDNASSKPSSASTRGHRNENRRGGRGGHFDGEARPPRNTNREGEVAQSGEDRPQRPRGDRPFRGGREFDRRSGSDRHDGPKKDVAGKGTWGDAVEAGVEAAVAPVVEPVRELSEEEKARIEARRIEAEEDAKLMTLEKYMADKKASEALSTLNLRKAGEGTDQSQWKGGVVLVKEEKNFFVIEKEEKAKKVAEKKTKTFYEIEQKFNEEPRPQYDDSRRGGDRRDGAPRGRGTFTPRGGRGGNAGGRGQGSKGMPIVKLDDSNAFPTLGGK